MMEKKFSLSGKKCVSKPRQSRKRPGCIRLFVCPTTGGRLEISVSPRESILGLKTALARKLKTNPARITLIYKEKALTSGRLVDYQIPEDSLLTLLPNMESGLSLHQSEKSITQALENLSETQVNDFLSGRAPLMLAIRMGENMVFVQLQLSTVTQGQSQPQVQGQPANQQPRPSVTPMTQRTATLLSQRGLSASALAQATRCLSRRIHHLHGMGASPSSSNHPSTVNQSLIPRMTVPVATSSSSSSSSSSSPSLSSPSSSKLPQSSPENTSSASTTIPMMKTGPANIRPLPPSSLPPQLPRDTTGPCLSLSPSPSAKSASPSLLQLPTANHLPLPQSGSALPSPPPSPGAVMNSFKHVGSGVYSGTFSGTLDSSLQEPNGQPRRSVNTILHILNDLLVASPASPRPQPTPSTTPTQTIGPVHQSPSTSHKSQQPESQQQHQVFFNQNSMLTPPPSPKEADSNGSFTMEEKADNEILRGKMQRVQMMLAQRKKLRGKRRQAIAPYCLQQAQAVAPVDCFPECSSDPTSDAVAGTSTSASPSSSAASSTSATSPPNSERPRICTHMEEGGECCSTYNTTSLDHDSLVV